MILECITTELTNIDWTAISAIASFLMVLITWRSIRVSLKQNRINRESNHKENEQNRATQIRMMSYENKIAWINQLRDAISYAQDLLTFAVQDKFILYKNQKLSSLNQLTSELFENANKVKRKLISVLYGSGIYEDKFLAFTDMFCKRYLNYILDLEFIHSIDILISQDDFKSKVTTYKARKNSSDNSNRRIWVIIEERGFGTKREDFSYYINEISNRYEFQDFESRCLELLDYELNIAKNILNGTENK